jgi:hypothetical protein
MGATRRQAADAVTPGAAITQGDGDALAQRRCPGGVDH